jgi:hypothetical protein
MNIEYQDIKVTDRKWGYGWTNSPARTAPDEYPRLADIPRPGVEGTLRQCAECAQDAAKLHTGGEWWWGKWFFKGRPITAIKGMTGDYDEDTGHLVNIREAWLTVKPTDMMFEDDDTRTVRVAVADDDLLDTDDVAAFLGVTPRRVCALAETYGIGRKVGRDWVFTPAQAQALGAARRGPGRPPGS